MFKKILHYTFRLPNRAFDISPFHQHGLVYAVGHSKAGAAADSGASLFNGQSSRVLVPYGDVWEEIDALRVEVLVRIDELGERHNLVEGLLSFALFVRGDGVVTGSYLALTQTEGPGASHSLVATVLGGGGSPDPFSTLGEASPEPDPPPVDMAWTGVSSDTEFAPDGVRRTVAAGAWTRITFIHNGFSMQLWIDDEMAGYRDNIESGVLGVQPGGVHLGAWPNANKYVLKGALDEVIIWKLDPSYLESQFFCRPMDLPTEACWRGLLHCLMRQWEDPDDRVRAEKVLECLDDADQALQRAIHSQGTQAVRQSRAFARRYAALWCEGRIDGPEMAELFKEFNAWLQRIAGAAFDGSIARLAACRQDLLALGCDDDLRCIAEHDPDWQAYVKLVGENFLAGYCSPPPRPDPTVREPSYPTSKAWR